MHIPSQSKTILAMKASTAAECYHPLPQSMNLHCSRINNPMAVEPTLPSSQESPNHTGHSGCMTHGVCISDFVHKRPPDCTATPRSHHLLHRVSRASQCRQVESCSQDAAAGLQSQTQPQQQGSGSSRTKSHVSKPAMDYR